MSWNRPKATDFYQRSGERGGPLQPPPTRPFSSAAPTSPTPPIRGHRRTPSPFRRTTLVSPQPSTPSPLTCDGVQLQGATFQAILPPSQPIPSVAGRRFSIIPHSPSGNILGYQPFPHQSLPRQTPSLGLHDGFPDYADQTEAWLREEEWKQSLPDYSYETIKWIEERRRSQCSAEQARSNAAMHQMADRALEDLKKLWEDAKVKSLLTDEAKHILKKFNLRHSIYLEPAIERLSLELYRLHYGKTALFTWKVPFSTFLRVSRQLSQEPLDSLRIPNSDAFVSPFLPTEGIPIVLGSGASRIFQSITPSDGSRSLNIAVEIQPVIEDVRWKYVQVIRVPLLGNWAMQPLPPTYLDKKSLTQRGWLWSVKVEEFPDRFRSLTSILRNRPESLLPELNLVLRSFKKDSEIDVEFDIIPKHRQDAMMPRPVFRVIASLGASLVLKHAGDPRDAVKRYFGHLRELRASYKEE